MELRYLLNKAETAKSYGFYDLANIIFAHIYANRETFNKSGIRHEYETYNVKDNINTDLLVIIFEEYRLSIPVHFLNFETAVRAAKRYEKVFRMKHSRKIKLLDDSSIKLLKSWCKAKYLSRFYKSAETVLNENRLAEIKQNITKFIETGVLPEKFS